MSTTLIHALAEDREQFLAFVRRRVRSGADAEDLLQQAMVKATEHVADLRDPEQVRAWFYRILRRVVADHHARWALRESKLAVLAADIDEATEEEVATCACSLGQLEGLRAEYAEILKRVDVDDEPIADVARALGITANNATVRLHRARRALRDHLKAFCGVTTMRACLDCTCELAPGSTRPRACCGDHGHAEAVTR